MKKKKLIRKTARLYAAISLLLFIPVFYGCSDKDYYEPGPEPTPGVGDDPSNLDFSTTQKVTFEFNHDVPEGTVSTFQVYTKNPFEKNSMGGWDMRSDLLPIASGIDVAGVSGVTRTLPAYVSDLYVYSPSLFVPTLMHGTISNGKATFKEFGLNMPINEEESATRSYGTGSFDYYMAGKRLSSVYEGAGIYYYRPPEQYITKHDFPNTVRNAITATFPEKVKAHPKYYTDASVYVSDDGNTGQGVDLWVSVISAQGQYNNSLAYFCFDGTKEEMARLTEAERSQFYVVCLFQFAKSSPTMYGALRPGEYVKLKYYNKNTQRFSDKFPVGTTVGWVLSANGFVKKGSDYVTQNRSASYPWYYSVPSWNPELNNKNHTIIFTAKDGDNKYVCFGFEDDNNDSARGDGDCNDVMFHVKVDPPHGIELPPEIPEEGEVEETETKNGYLAFEDNWPKKGDYDLNDVVAKYKSSITYVHKVKGGSLPANRVAAAPEEPYVKEITDKFSLVHAGANYTNAFAYKVDISPERLTKITVNGSPANIVPDGNGFLVELCPNVNEVIVPYQYGTTPKDYDIVMEFSKEPGTCVTQDEFNSNEWSAPYNPYISPRAGVEVHLPMYPPTGKVTQSLFGTEDDRSGNGLWYVSGDKNNYPFALHLSGVDGFTVPAEEKSIDKTYPKYINWVESGKSQDKDWYLYPEVK